MRLPCIRHKSIDSKKFITFSIREIISDSLKKYPFTETEQAYVQWDDVPGNDFSVWGDPVLTMHVLFNLIKNSLYHTRDKMSQARIEFSCHESIDYNELHVKDNGHGIPEEILPHIFDAFYTSRASGSGIGLAFCKMVMQAYRGNIICHSESGQGTHFILQFPKAKPH